VVKALGVADLSQVMDATIAVEGDAVAGLTHEALQELLRCAPGGARVQ
jgi:hypothetical protein